MIMKNVFTTVPEFSSEPLVFGFVIGFSAPPISDIRCRGPVVFGFYKLFARAESGELFSLGICVTPRAIKGALLWEGSIFGLV